jgi:hypothetical protein
MRAGELTRTQTACWRNTAITFVDYRHRSTYENGEHGARRTQGRSYESHLYLYDALNTSTRPGSVSKET